MTETADRLTSRDDSSPVTPRQLRGRSVANLFRMGHCAPTVMKTVLDAFGRDATWLVRLVAGLPGGIGNSGHECGGITAPLVLLGLRHACDSTMAGVPATVWKGHALIQAFQARHGTTSCRDILRDARLPLRCIGVVRHAPEQYVEVRSRACDHALSGERREAYACLYAHFRERGFHCAHAVLRHYLDSSAVTQDLLDATSAFVGGTVFAGMTCSALTAGVMLIGLELGEIENSLPRVLRLIGTMAVRGDAFAEDLNAFNRAMNRGHDLARWFKASFGDTQCRAVTRCDFSTLAGVRQYVDGDCATRCNAIASDVALQVRGMVERAGARGFVVTRGAPSRPQTAHRGDSGRWSR